jgi:Cof subfamily protein (haloacid dehalogenase superfamily)
VTLVALDLDGTLLTEASVLTAAHERAVHDLRRLGAHVALVTGRPVLTTTPIWRRLGLTTPAVCFNGGWYGHPGQPAMAALQLTEPEMRDLLAALAVHDGVACGYPDEKSWWMDRSSLLDSGWATRYGSTIEVRPEAFADWTGPSLKLMFVAEPAVIPGIARGLRHRFGDRFAVVVSQADRLEVLPRGISKVWGLSRLAARLGIARERVWAVGDAENDLEMIAWAGHGCAMGHAPDHLREVARHILPGIEARGLAALVPLVAKQMADGR